MLPSNENTNLSDPTDQINATDATDRTIPTTPTTLSTPITYLDMTEGQIRQLWAEEVMRRVSQWAHARREATHPYMYAR